MESHSSSRPAVVLKGLVQEKKNFILATQELYPLKSIHEIGTRYIRAISDITSIDDSEKDRRKEIVHCHLADALYPIQQKEATEDMEIKELPELKEVSDLVSECQVPVFVTGYMPSYREVVMGWVLGIELYIRIITYLINLFIADKMAAYYAIYSFKVSVTSFYLWKLFKVVSDRQEIHLHYSRYRLWWRTFDIWYGRVYWGLRYIPLNQDNPKWIIDGFQLPRVCILITRSRGSRFNYPVVWVMALTVLEYIELSESIQWLILLFSMGVCYFISTIYRNSTLDTKRE